MHVWGSHFFHKLSGWCSVFSLNSEILLTGEHDSMECWLVNSEVWLCVLLGRYVIVFCLECLTYPWKQWKLLLKMEYFLISNEHPSSPAVHSGSFSLPISVTITYMVKNGIKMSPSHSSIVNFLLYSWHVCDFVFIAIHTVYTSRLKFLLILGFLHTSHLIDKVPSPCPSLWWYGNTYSCILTAY